MVFKMDKDKFLRIIRRMFLLFVVSLTIINFVNAANLGVSPASLRYENVLRDGYSERSIVISIDSDEPIKVFLEPRGDIGTWLNFSDNNFSVSRDNLQKITVSVSPPGDTPNGNYSGFLRISTSNLGEGVEGHAVGIIKSTLDLVIDVEVVDVEIRDCGVVSINAISSEIGDDLVFNLDIVNNGNVRIKPRVVVDIWDQDQINILKSVDYSDKEILPTTQDRVSFKTSSTDLEIGQFWADVSVLECLSSSFITFDVLEEGALKADGLLLRILTRPNASVGETVPIEVTFKNTGEKEVSAQFKGSVSKDGRVVQVLESLPSLVSVGEIEKFSFFFTPEDDGKYVISGRVFYSSKKTFESSTTIDVFRNKKSSLRFLLVSIYVVFAILILFLYYKIRKERRRFLDRLRRIK